MQEQNREEALTHTFFLRPLIAQTNSYKFALFAAVVALRGILNVNECPSCNIRRMGAWHMDDAMMRSSSCVDAGKA